jgi:hypothetical protein
MLFYRILSFTLIAVGLWAMWSQIIWPVLTSRSLFPLFRPSAHQLEKKLADVNQRLDEMQVKKEIKSKQRVLNKE